MLKELNYFMDTETFSREDILYTYSGIRPLPFEPDKKEKKVTRKHIIHDHEDEGFKNYYSIVGGKLTTFRSLAEDTMDYIDKKNGSQNKCRTKDYKFIKEQNGTIIYELLSEKYEIDIETITFLNNYYGDKFIEVLKLTDEDKSLKEKISHEHIDIKAQIVYAIKNEKAKTLKDIILGYNSVSKIAEIATEILYWSEERNDEEISNFKESIHYYYNINNNLIYNERVVNVNA